MTQSHTAGSTRKSHKSRKTTAQEPVKPETSVMPDGGPSSTALTTQAESPALPIPVQEMLQEIVDGKKDAVSTAIPAVDPKKQWWIRPRDSKSRKMAEKIVVLRAAGHEDKAIAKKLHTTPGTIRQTIFIARKNKWLDDEDEPIDLETEMALTIDRKIVRNIDASLDGQMTNWQTHEMTIAAAKGRGHFKNHEVNKNEGPQTLPVVAIQVIMPPVGAGDQLPEVREDQMGGTPAYASIEGEVAEEPA